MKGIEASSSPRTSRMDRGCSRWAWRCTHTDKRGAYSQWTCFGERVIWPQPKWHHLHISLGGAAAICKLHGDQKRCLFNSRVFYPQHIHIREWRRYMRRWVNGSLDVHVCIVLVPRSAVPWTVFLSGARTLMHYFVLHLKGSSKYYIKSTFKVVHVSQILILEHLYSRTYLLNVLLLVGVNAWLKWATTSARQNHKTQTTVPKVRSNNMHESIHAESEMIQNITALERLLFFQVDLFKNFFYFLFLLVRRESRSLPTLQTHNN